MVLRNVTRHPLRAAASIFGIGFAVAILMIGFVFTDAMDRLIATQFWVAERQDVTVSFVEPRSDAARHALARLPGVDRGRTAAHASPCACPLGPSRALRRAHGRAADSALQAHRRSRRPRDRDCRRPASCCRRCWRTCSASAPGDTRDGGSARGHPAACDRSTVAGPRGRHAGAGAVHGDGRAPPADARGRCRVRSAAADRPRAGSGACASAQGAARRGRRRLQARRAAELPRHDGGEHEPQHLRST